MSSQAEVSILIRAKTDFDKAQREIARLTGSFASFGKTAALVGGAGLAAMIAGGFKLLGMAREETVGIARLQAAIRTLPPAMQAQAASVEQIVAQRERLAFSDDQIRESLALLIAQTGSYDAALSRNRLAMDVSRGTGMDFATASRLLGKINDETTNTFARYGIVIRDVATETEALAEIQRRFAGQAVSYAETPAAKWEFFKNQLSNMAETIGGALLPAFSNLSAAAGDWLVTHQPQIQAFADALAIGIAGAIDKVSAAFQASMPYVQPFIDFVVDHPEDVMFMAGVIGGALVAAIVAAGVAATAAFVANPFTAWMIGISLLAVGLTMLVRHWDAVWAGMQAAPQATLNWLKSHWSDVLVGIVFGPLGLIIKHWDDIWHAMPGPVQDAMNFIAGIVETVINGILAGFRKVADVIDAITGRIGSVAGALSKVPGLGFMGSFKGTNLSDMIPSVDFTLDRSRGRESQRLGHSGLEDLESSAKKAVGALAMLPPLLDGGGGGGGGGVAGGATAAANGLAQLDGAFQDWLLNNPSGQLSEFVARLELAQEGLLGASGGASAASDEAFRAQVELHKLAIVLGREGISGEAFMASQFLRATADNFAAAGVMVTGTLLDILTAMRDFSADAIRFAQDLAARGMTQSSSVVNTETGERISEDEFQRRRREGEITDPEDWRREVTQTPLPKEEGSALDRWAKEHGVQTSSVTVHNYGPQTFNGKAAVSEMWQEMAETAR